MRHKRIIELKFTDSTDDMLDSNYLLDTLASDEIAAEDIEIELDTTDQPTTKIKISAYDDVLTDEMRQALDSVAHHIISSALVSDDF